MKKADFDGFFAYGVGVCFVFFVCSEAFVAKEHLRLSLRELAAIAVTASFGTIAYAMVRGKLVQAATHSAKRSAILFDAATLTTFLVSFGAALFLATDQLLRVALIGLCLVCWIQVMLGGSKTQPLTE